MFLRQAADCKLPVIFIKLEVRYISSLPKAAGTSQTSITKDTAWTLWRDRSRLKYYH